MEEAIMKLANLVDILTKRMLDENKRLRDENEELLGEITRLHVNKQNQEVIKDNGYKWNDKTKTLEKIIEPKFDVSTLRPFDKVLCRMNDDDIWGISLFERYIPTNPYPFFCIQDAYNQCIPYNGETIHLLGTTQQVSDKYINW